MCFVKTLYNLVNVKCIQRYSLCTSNCSFYATYVIHSPFLVKRKEAILKLLYAAHTKDVTFVTCIERTDVNKFSHNTRSCLYVSTPNPFDKYNTILANGTISLALKHRLAYLDITQRNLSSALILEDDATFKQPSYFWNVVNSFRIPENADIFYLGSYLSFTNWIAFLLY